MNTNTRLYKLLNGFNGAKATLFKSKEDNLIDNFEQIAQEMIYGGYIRVRDEYAIFISKVEFYYHEEEAVQGERIVDDIVYHRDGRFIKRKVPYFPVMTLHFHWSGFDITFEKESGHYRASALIRQYVVLDLKEKEKQFVELKTSGNSDKAFEKKEQYRPVGSVLMNDKPVIDTRSTYLQYFLNGFSMNGDDSKVEWCEISNPEYHKPKRETRQNAPDHDWGFIYGNKKEYEASVLRAKDIL